MNCLTSIAIDNLLSLIAILISFFSLGIVIYDRRIKLSARYNSGDGWEGLEIFNNSSKKLCVYYLKIFYSSHKCLAKREYVSGFQDDEGPIEFEIEPNGIKKLEFKEQYRIKNNQSRQINNKMFIIIYFGGNKSKIIRINEGVNLNGLLARLR